MLKCKSVETLRETSKLVYRIPDAKKMSRDELAERICEMLKSDPIGYLLTDLDLLPTDVMSAIYEMVDEGSLRLKTTGDEGVLSKILERLYFVDCKQWKEGKFAGTNTFSLPKELCHAISESSEEIDSIRRFGDDVELYANCAVILYGVVSLSELIEIFERYFPEDDGVLDEGRVRCYLMSRCDEESEWFLHGKLVCHREFQDADESVVDDLIEDFFDRRKRSPRWYPGDRDEFERYCEEYANLETPEAKALDKWLADNGLDGEDERIAALYEALYSIQHEERFAKVIERLLDAATGKGIDGATQEFVDIINNFAGNMRLRVNNGHSGREMLEMSASDRPAPFMLKVNPRAEVGRNDPCPCGSGKKFKKCCGMKTKKAEKISARAMERLAVYLPMRDKTSKFVRRHVVPLNTLESQRAAGERIGITKNGKVVGRGTAETFASIVGDYTAMMDDSRGEPPIKRLIAQESRFSGDDREALEMFKKYRYTWLEILDAEPGVGVKCRDLLLDKEIFLMECSFSCDYGVKGMTLCAGIGELPNGTYMILGVMHPAGFENPRTILNIVLAHLGIERKPPITLSFSEQARFAAETIKRINAIGRFAQVKYGGVDEG